MSTQVSANPDPCVAVRYIQHEQLSRLVPLCTLVAFALAPRGNAVVVNFITGRRIALPCLVYRPPQLRSGNCSLSARNGPYRGAQTRPSDMFPQKVKPRLHRTGNDCQPETPVRICAYMGCSSLLFANPTTTTHNFADSLVATATGEHFGSLHEWSIRGESIWLSTAVQTVHKSVH